MTPISFGAVDLIRKTGNEKFSQDTSFLDINLLSFWQWSASDLVSNATRGRLAEFIVGQALHVDMNVRNEWGACDLIMQSGLKIEVKSAAYLQTWAQEKFSVINFIVPKTKEWNRQTNQQSVDRKRQADVYIFALLKHQDKLTLDPMDLDQWEFYVLETSELDQRLRSQHSITLKSLREIAQPVSSGELFEEVSKLRKG